MQEKPCPCDRPAGHIAQLAMRETARLPMFTHLEKERRVLKEDSYMNDILTSHNDLKRLDESTKEVKEILKAVFFPKPWVRSGQSGKQKQVPGKPGPGISTGTQKGRQSLYTPKSNEGRRQ